MCHPQPVNSLLWTLVNNEHFRIQEQNSNTPVRVKKR